MPTAFIGFLPNSLLYVAGYMDHRLLTFMFAVPLVLIGPRKTNNDFGRIPGIWALCLVGATVVLRTAWSLYSGVSLFEVVAVLRWNFTWPIFAVCVLYYASRLPANRLYGVLRMFLLLYSLHVCLITVSLVTDVDFFLNKNTLEKSLQYIDQGLAVDNLRAFPLHIFIGTALLTMVTMVTMVSKRLWTYCILLMLSLSLPLLYTRRMYTVTLFIQTFAIYLSCCFLKERYRRVLFHPFMFLFLLLGFYCIAPSRIDRFIDKMLPAFEKTQTTAKILTLEEIGTYSFRMSLLKDAKEEVAYNKCQVFGIGYRREYNILRPGGYSYVMGKDSFVASVIFCEGWGGLCLRILPYLLLFLHNVKRLLLVKDRKLKIYSIMVVSVIIAQIPAYLQTSLICHYDYFYVPLAFIELILIKGQKNNERVQTPA